MNIESMRARPYHSIAVDEGVSEAAAERYRTLQAYDRLVDGGCSQEAALEQLGISRRTLYRWKAALAAGGQRGLPPVQRAAADAQLLQRGLLAASAVDQAVVGLQRPVALGGRLGHALVHGDAVVRSRPHGLDVHGSGLLPMFRITGGYPIRRGVGVRPAPAPRYWFSDASVPNVSELEHSNADLPNWASRQGSASVALLAFTAIETP